MNIHEFGRENRECVLFLHASCTGWDFYEEGLRLLARRYHVIVPAMPETAPAPPTEIQYWYGSLEKRARAWDIAYVKKTFPQTRFVEINGLDHAEYALLHPAAFAQRLTGFWEEREPS